MAGAEGLATGEATVSANGDWAFVDLTISAEAKPGRRTLVLTTPSGSTAIPFELLRRLPAKGRFQGFSPDDVIYLAMPDRFADGDRPMTIRPVSPACSIAPSRATITAAIWPASSSIWPICNASA